MVVVLKSTCIIPVGMVISCTVVVSVMVAMVCDSAAVDSDWTGPVD